MIFKKKKNHLRQIRTGIDDFHFINQLPLNIAFPIETNVYFSDTCIYLNV